MEKVITGKWGGEIICRPKTIEDKLREKGILEGANLFIALSETMNNKKNKVDN